MDNSKFYWIKMENRMKYIIKSIKENDYEEALELIWKSFLQFDAQYCDDEGIKSYERDVINNPMFIRMVQEETNYIWGAYYQNRLCGVMVVRRTNHIMLLYVNSTMLRNGIGSALVNELKYSQHIITVNASPFAVEFYKKLGFEVIDTKKNRHGIISIPMILKLNK